MFACKLPISMKLDGVVAGGGGGGGITSIPDPLNINSVIANTIKTNSFEAIDICASNITVTNNLTVNNIDLNFSKKPNILSDPSYERSKTMITLKWREPDFEWSNFNFIANPHQLTSSYNNKNMYTTINSISGFDLNDYNFFPYYDSLKIEYQTEKMINDPDDPSWILLKDSSLAIPTVIDASSPNIYPLTSNINFYLGQVGQQNVLGSYQVNGNTLIYTNRYLFEASDISSENRFRFKLYLTNNWKPTKYFNSNTKIDWPYIIIPDDGGWIELISYSDPTMPLFIEFVASTSYTNIFNISGANNNDGSGQITTSANAIAETGLNTKFVNLPSSIRVKYRFTLSGEKMATSKQVITSDMESLYNDFSFINHTYISNLIGNNNWSLDNDQDYTFSNSNLNPKDVDNKIVFPKYHYTISNYGMGLYGGGELIEPGISYNNISISMETVNPSRDNVTEASTKYKNNFNDLSFGISGNSSQSTSNTNNINYYVANNGDELSVYKYNETNLINRLNPCFFLEESNMFQITFPDINIPNNLDANDSSYGKDLSDQEICYFRLYSQQSDLSGPYTKGFIGNDDASFVKNSYFQFSQSESKDAAHLIGTDAEKYRRQGWYLGVDVSNIVADVCLNLYPDVCGNDPSYIPYTISFEQISKNGEKLSESSYTFYIGKRPSQDISLTEIDVSGDITEWTSNDYNYFFGLKRVKKDLKFNIFTRFTQLDPFWKPSINITDSLQIKLNDSQNQGSSSSSTIIWPQDGSTELANNLSITFNKQGYKNRNKFSRDVSFQLDGTYNNNIAREYNSHDAVTYNFSDSNYLAIQFNDKDLWWDYTWDNTWDYINDFMKAEEVLYPGVTANFSSNFSATQYNHNESLAYSQLMWCNGGFRAGGRNDTNNPYINYDYFNNTQDYSIYDDSGTILYENDFNNIQGITVNSSDYFNSSATPSSMSGTYKWIMIKAHRSNSTTNANILVTGNGLTGDKTDIGVNYLLYIYETVIQSPAVKGWTQAQRKNPTGLENNKNGTGCYMDGENYPIKLNSTQAEDVYFRIGLKNNSDITISNITINFG